MWRVGEEAQVILFVFILLLLLVLANFDLVGVFQHTVPPPLSPGSSGLLSPGFRPRGREYGQTRSSDLRRTPSSSSSHVEIIIEPPVRIFPVLQCERFDLIFCFSRVLAVLHLPATTRLAR